MLSVLGVYAELSGLRLCFWVIHTCTYIYYHKADIPDHMILKTNSKPFQACVSTSTQTVGNPKDVLLWGPDIWTPKPTVIKQLNNHYTQGSIYHETVS